MNSNAILDIKNYALDTDLDFDIFLGCFNSYGIPRVIISA